MDTIEKDLGFSIRGTIKSQENGGWTNMRVEFEQEENSGKPCKQGLPAFHACKMLAVY